MRRAALAAAIAVLAATAGGCGPDESAISNGGRIAGDTLTVYSLLPRTGPDAAAARDAVLGEKLALQQANGKAGPLTVNYVALDLPQQGRKRIANAARDAIDDPSIAAVIGDLSPDTARTTAPLFNAAGILHLSPGVSAPGFGRGPALEPSGRRTFAPLLVGDQPEGAALARAAGKGKVAVEATPDQEALAAQVRQAAGRTVPTRKADTVVVLAGNPDDAFGVVDSVLSENPHARVVLPPELWASDLPERLQGRGRVRFLTMVGPASNALYQRFQQTFGTSPGPYAQVGYDAMRSVLAAVRRTHGHAESRERIINAYFDGPAARRPWLLAQRTRDGGTVTEPLTR